MHLSQRSMILSGLIILLGIAGSWGGGSMESLWRWPALLFLLLLVTEWFIVRRQALGVTLGLPPRAWLGRDMTLDVEVKNTLDVLLGMQLYLQSPPSVKMPRRLDDWMLAPRSLDTRSYHFVAEELGEHGWPELISRVRGRFGLAWWRKKLPQSQNLTVIPESLENNRRHVPGMVMAGEKPRALHGEGSEFLKLREYQQGDGLRMIDWKATARGQKFMVREFSEDQHLEIVIAIDVGRSSAVEAGNLTRLGHYANVAARFAEYVLLNNDRVGLITFADVPVATVRPGQGVTTLRRIRGELEALRSLPGESNALLAMLHLNRIVRQRSLVVLLTDLDDADAAGQLARAAKLLMPKHLPLVAGLRDMDVASMEEEKARDWLDPYRSLAAAEHRLQNEANILRLRRLGSKVIHAPPLMLDQSVFDTYMRLRQRRSV